MKISYFVEFVGKDYFVPKGHSALCSLHFKESDIKKVKTRTILKSGALPQKEERHEEAFDHPIFQGVQKRDLPGAKPSVIKVTASIHPTDSNPTVQPVNYLSVH